MRRHPTPVSHPNDRRGLPTVLAVLCLGLAGCASPGVPRPPSLRLPAPVRDLTAMRRGNTVELHFTAPQETTDHQSLVTGKRGPMPLRTVLCRVDAGTCRPFARLDVLPGAPVDATDTLPPALLSGPPHAVAYRVTVTNPAGRDAGASRDAVAAAGEAPPAVLGLMASTVQGGVQLTWRPEPGTTVHVEAVTSRPIGKPQTRLLQPGCGASRLDAGGAVDPEPAVGAQVSYRVFRTRTVTANGATLTLEGAPAQVTATRLPDTFAPAAPTGLLAVASTTPDGKPEVDLSWEPSSEADLLGYNVYRVSATGTGNSQLAKINAAPVTTVSYGDPSVQAGADYRYAVSAVDRSGNESQRSAPIAVSAQSNNP